MVVKILAIGKEAVLNLLEGDAAARLARAGEPGSQGIYLLSQDDDGTLLVVIAGHTFKGTDTIKLGNKTFTTDQGVVTVVE